MELAILNYGTGVNVTVPSYASKEDDRIIQMVRGIVEARNMGKGGLTVSEVMHTDLANLNFRRYRTKGLPEAVASFHTPLYTPFIMHHSEGGDVSPKNISVGSNVFAEFIKRRVELHSGVASGYVKVGTFIPKSSMIGEQSAIEAVQSRQLMGLSIGSRVEPKNYRCSICGNPLYSEECDHSPGREYDGQMCFADVYSPFFREFSAVYSPSDVNAMIRRMDVLESESGARTEFQVDTILSPWNVALYEIGGKVYPSAAIDDKEDDAMPRPHEEQEQEISNIMSRIEEKYEKLLEAKNRDILALARALESRLDEEIIDALPESEEGDEDEPDEGDGSADDDGGSGDSEPDGGEDEAGDEDGDGGDDEGQGGEDEDEGPEGEGSGEDEDGSDGDAGEPGEGATPDERDETQNGDMTPQEGRDYRSLIAKNRQAMRQRTNVQLRLVPPRGTNKR